MKVSIIPFDEAFLPEHEELQGSPTVRMGEDGLEVIRQLKCSWAEASRMAIQLIGRVEGTSTPGLDMIFYLGHKMTWSMVEAKVTYVIAEDVEIKPFGKEDQGETTRHGVYDFAILVVTYRACTSDNLKLLTDESFRPAAEFLTQAPEGFYWDATQLEMLTVDEAPNRILRTAEYDYLIKKVPIELVGELLGRMGGVNDSEITSVKYNKIFEIGTLLCLPLEVEPQVTLMNEEFCDVVLHFAYRPEMWNKFYKHGAKNPSSIYNTEGSEVKPYSEISFSYLFLEET